MFSSSSSCLPFSRCLPLSSYTYLLTAGHPRLSKGLEVLKDCTNLKFLSINDNKFKEVRVEEYLSLVRDWLLDYGDEDSTTCRCQLWSPYNPSLS